MPFIIKNKNNILAYGSNNYGQLGLGSDQEIVTEPTRVNISNVKEVFTGNSATFFLTNEGRVYVCGRNDYGQLGSGNLINKNIPTLITTISDVVNIWTTNYHNVFFMKRNGRIYFCGQNTYGESGTGRTGNVAIPTEVYYVSNVKKISSDYYSTFFLTTDGKLYSCGYNNYGQLGAGHLRNTTSPTNIATNVVDVTTKSGSTYFIKSDKTVHSFGYNNHGQLGINSTTNQISPTKISLNNVINMAILSYGVLFLTSDSKLYSCGQNTYGELGLGHTNTVFAPTLINSLNNIKSIQSVGNSCFVIIEGKLYSFGNNSNGQLGLGHTNYVSIPTMVNTGGIDVIEVNNQGATIMILLKNGEVYNFGLNATTFPSKIDVGSVKTLSYVSPPSYYKYLLQDGDEIKTYNNGWNTIGLNDVTIQMFEMFGIDDLSILNKDILSSLSSNKFTLLVNSDSDSIPKANISGNINDQLIRSTSDIYSKYLKLINVYGSGDIKLVLSFDSGVTWKSYKDNNWIVVDGDNKRDISEKGMTISEVSLIPHEKVEEVNTSWKFRINYLLEKVEGESLQLLKTELKEDIIKKSPIISKASLYLLNTKSTINLELNGKNLIGTLNDIDKTKVQYRVLLNDKPYFPEDGSFTTLSTPPMYINTVLDSKKIKIKENNKIKVEFQDYWGSFDIWEASFIGNHYGLVFEDKNGSAYSTEFGEILKQLDFGTLIAGQTSLEHEVKLYNKTGFPVENVIIDYETLQNTSLELSKTQSPFIAQSKIVWEEELGINEFVTFYTRVKTDKNSTPQSNINVDLNVKANPTRGKV